MADGTEEQATPRLDGMNYQVEKPLGAGAGSSILLIRDEATGTRYALKVVKRQQPSDDVYVDQARHEFEILQQLDHSAIVKAFDLRVKKAWFKVRSVEILMEYVDGLPLDSFAKKLPVGHLVVIFGQVASALDHMHKKGVYHGDLKPSNVMIARSGDVKMIDLGTAWIEGSPKNRVQGTLLYMAPEQGRLKVVNARTDLYNFGATMYRMFTGEFANSDGSPGDLAAAVGVRVQRVTPASQLNPKVPPELDSLIMACLETSPDKRPASAAAVREQLKTLARKLGVSLRDLKAPDARPS